MKSLVIALLLASFPLASMAKESIRIPMNVVNSNGMGASVGEVVVTETKYGLVFTPKLTGLSPGLHGFHLHENPSCMPKEKDGKKVPALAAGGHYDPKQTGKHGFPWGEGHLGDLSALYVNPEGKTPQPVLAPRLKLSDLGGRSLMVHMGGDNYSDLPTILGGGGARVVCGVIPTR
jgi:superoxide dismutase, Cu-Zn family